VKQIRFDDIDGLNGAASDVFDDWGPSTKVTQDMVDAFADLTGDHQWIHADVERAKRDSPFGGTIAHGFLTLSLLPALGAQTVRITGQSSAVNYGAERLRFLAPVPIPSEVHARSRLVRAEARPKGTLITTEADLSVVGADKPSVLYMMQVLYLP
jgi:acyl dehydratase